ncbi:unnamed protein product, partial [Staurois parvus]
MIGADPRSDNCRFSAVLSSRSDSVRKVQPRTGKLHFPVISVSLDTADHMCTHQCRSSVPSSAAQKCPPVPPICAHQCPAVPPISAQQCHPSVPPIS